MGFRSNRFKPHNHKIAPIVGLVVILALAFGFFKFLSGDGVINATREGTFTGYATVLDKETKRKKCSLSIRRDDGIKELKPIGWQKECGKYEIGQKIHITQGFVDD